MTRQKNQGRRTGAQRQRVEVRMDQVAAALARTRTLLSAEDHALFTQMADTLAWVTGELQAKDVSVDRLRQTIFGASSERTADVLSEGTNVPADAQQPASAQPTTPRPKAPGQGRNGAAAYTGATQVSVTHPHLHSGESCPGCMSGKLHAQNEPAKLLRITGVAPLSATVYERERLRCNLCGEV